MNDKTNSFSFPNQQQTNLLSSATNHFYVFSMIFDDLTRMPIKIFLLVLHTFSIKQTLRGCETYKEKLEDFVKHWNNV